MLLLFDIDGTLLLRAAEAHRLALLQAIGDVHGVVVETDHGVETAGRTDPEIARLVLLRLGVPAERIDDRAGELQDAACAAYARLAPPDLSGNVAPGIGELLRELDRRAGVVLSLVTGNFELIARLKLNRAGIGRHFADGQGGFGSDSESRTDLPRIARGRAAHGNGALHPRESTILIGDTPRDIACARADGVRVIAVATGPSRASELSGADWVVEDGDALRSLVLGLLETARP